MLKLIIPIIFVLFVPIFVSAHSTMMDFGNYSENELNMMRYVEDKALGSDELHEEMEDLMIKMMSGKLTQDEADRMAELMNQYPGTNSMMMNRMMGFDYGDHMTNWPLKTTPAGIWVWLLVVCTVIWSVVGILAIIWLGRQLKIGSDE